MEGKGRVALVTGASAGIGEALAHRFAQLGFDLVITARRQDRLEAVAGDIRSARGVRVEVVPADLADPAAPVHLKEEIEARGMHVDALANNAGYGLPGQYRNTRWQDQADFLRVLVTSVCQLTHLFVPGMVDRNYGRIINVASVAGLVPGAPGHTLYPASKAFLIRFSESLALELSETDVHVSALCPGFTYSEFHDVTGTRDRVNQMPGYMWMDAERVAQLGVAAVMNADVVCVPGGFNRLVTSVMKHMPGGLARGIVGRRSRTFRSPEP